MTADLVAWLRNILDEDQCVAEAANPGPWRWNYDATDTDDLYNSETPPWAELESSGDRTVISCEGNLCMYGTADAEHIALHDPAAVLADIESKRALIEHHTYWESISVIGGVETLKGRYCHVCEYGANLGPADWPCQTLRYLARAYAHRPGYDPQWSPEFGGYRG